MHEFNNSKSLKIIKRVANLLNVELVCDFDIVIFDLDSKCKVLDEMKVNYVNLLIMIVLIEDRNYYKHNGVDFKSIIRAFLSNILFFRKIFNLLPSGGSTIYMQLSRSAFIKSYSGKYQRKILEIILSLWINRCFTKQEILRFYINSVRYEKNIIGLENAIKYFFTNNIKNKIIQIEEAFFLTERLSNITSTINWNRINSLYNRISYDLVIENDIVESIYKNQIIKNKLNSSLC